MGVPALAVTSMLAVATATGTPSAASLLALFVGTPGLFLGLCRLLELLVRVRADLDEAAPSASDRALGSAMTLVVICGLLTIVACIAWFAPALFPGVR